MDYTKVSDLLSGKNVFGRYSEYMESQWYSRADIYQLQATKLFRLMEHCYNHVPYYRNIMKSKGIIPSDFKDQYTLAQMPVITKETIKSNYQAFKPTNLSKIRGVKSGQTGGTTGSILVKRNDANTRSSIWGAFKRFENWMGYTSRDKALILMGGHVAHNHDFQYFKGEILSFIINAMKKQIVINPYSTDAGVTNSIISHLINSDVKLVRGYSQFLYNLCQQMKERGVSCHIPAITTTAEPLMLQHRELFKDVLGAESYDQYGCGEVGGVAFECEKHEGMHITEERVIVEQNESNDLILTDLDNYAMPFVRYHNADQAVVKNEKCSCGREHRLIEKVMGRTCDYVIGLNGEYLHWAYFWHLVFDSGIAKNRDLKKFQIVQESKDTIVFKYIASSLNSMEIKSMTDNIQSRLGKIEVVFQQEIEIPNASTGKYRPVVNKLIS